MVLLVRSGLGAVDQGLGGPALMSEVLACYLSGLASSEASLHLSGLRCLVLVGASLNILLVQATASVLQIPRSAQV